MAAVTMVTRVQQLLQQRIDAALREFDLTFARYEILMLLTFSRQGQLPMSKIGSRLQVHPASVTSAVERLERQGFVQRDRTQADRRTVLARITPQGRHTALAATEVLNAEVFADIGLGARETRELTGLLARIRGGLGD